MLTAAARKLLCRRTDGQTDVHRGTFRHPRGFCNCRSRAAAAHGMPRSTGQSRPHLRASWAATATQAISPHTPRSRRVAHAAGAVSLGAHGKDGVAAALSRRTCYCVRWRRRRACHSGEQHGFLCLRGQCPLQHETEPFWCKHLCFIRFTLFLFFYFELYTFEK